MSGGGGRTTARTSRVDRKIGRTSPAELVPDPRDRSDVRAGTIETANRLSRPATGSDRLRVRRQPTGCRPGCRPRDERSDRFITALVGEGAQLDPPTLVPAGCPPTSTRGRIGNSCADTSASPPMPLAGQADSEPSSPRCLFRRAADPRNLRCAIDYLALEGGSSPGRTA